MSDIIEFFATYGWAILIVAIVVGALYVFGVFDPLPEERPNNGATKAEDWTCTKYENHTIIPVTILSPKITVRPDCDVSLGIICIGKTWEIERKGDWTVSYDEPYNQLVCVEKGLNCRDDVDEIKITALGPDDAYAGTVFEEEILNRTWRIEYDSLRFYDGYYSAFLVDDNLPSNLRAYDHDYDVVLYQFHYEVVSHKKICDERRPVAA